MNIVGFLILVAAPLTALALCASLACGLAALCGKPHPRRVHWLGRATWFALWGLALAAAVGILPLQEYPDLVHTYWAITLPLAALFLGSGMILAGAPAGNAAQRERGPWVFLLCAALLVLLPLLRHGYLSGEAAIPRGTIELPRALLDLVRWNFGASMPAYLEPHSPAATARGIDFLPRVLTVPLGACLQLAWIWIAAGLLVLVARACQFAARPARALELKRALLFLAPAASGLLVAAGAIFDASIGPLKADFFTPFRRDGIWTSDPLVLETFGPLLLAALGMALLVLLVGRRSQAPQA